MPRLSPEKITEIRQSVDIVDVIGNYLPLYKRGRNYLAICPFHDDTNPSLSISPERQIYKCFVCDHAGNVFGFLKDYLKISYIDAVKMVAQLGNVDISQYNLESRVEHVDSKLEPLYLMHDEANKIYRHYLTTKLGLEAKDYLTNRQISDEIIETFEIGYAPANQVLLKAFEKMNFDRIKMYESGLIIESGPGYDRFSNRIMFPLHDSLGRVVGFSGRIFQSSQNESKYMNSPESAIFIKGDTLYNYHRVGESVRQAGYVIITEGFMDVIAYYKAGIKNVLAIMGTALTSGHLRLLKRLTRTIYLCLDGDRAGRNAMIKCMETLLKAGFKVKVIALPDGLDPDEFLNKQGVASLQELIKNPLSALDFKMDYYYDITNMENYEERKHYLEMVAKDISELDDIVDQDYYVHKLEKKSGFSKNVIEQLIYQNTMQLVKQSKPVREIPVVKRNEKLLNKYDQAQRDLLYYMLLDKNVAMTYVAKAGFMVDDTYRLLASYIVDYYRQKPILEIADFIDGIEDENLVQNIIEISQLNLPKEIDMQAINDYINVIKDETVVMRKKELTEALSNTFDPQQKAQILKEIIALKDKE
ncbi:DNA primase [uncultured Thomasclavelia sp.]|uniref:DNA primase n=1 Tax=uncultured Thomasclavelia sp. TaxID=3025759 RepID=UPI0025FE1EB7|nr:DNA primase [uncultured Thomasclavelia sp.]